MKKIIFITIYILLIQVVIAQRNSIDGDGFGHGFYPYPPISQINGETCWCGEPISKMVQTAECIFEGRILSYSIHQSNTDDDVTDTDYRVLVLKQFKGNFISDTIIVQNYMWGWQVGDEALFCLYSYGSVFHILHGSGCGFIGVCNRTNVKKELYEPIEKVLGYNYIDVHPNTCAIEKQK
jgi:hypothetical protein